MSSGLLKKNHDYIVEEEDEKPIEEKIKEHNRTLQRLYFKRLKEMFLDLINHVNKREFITRSNLLITTLLTRDLTPLPDTYQRAKEIPINKAHYESRVALAKEIGPNHKEVKDLSLRMEFFF